MYSIRDRGLGMQVHGVPDAERAVDKDGHKLPWGYEYSSILNADSDRPPLVEKGPFGRSMRRSRSGASRSRSKTAEPRKEEDRIRAENIAAEDAIFGSLRKVGIKDEGRRDALGEVDQTTGVQPAARSTVETENVPTEVMLWGFGEELQWAAIDFYERVSNGVILEDYDRQPPGQRYDYQRSLGRAAAQRSLSKAAVRKKNRFAGGEHWIKVTFDSSQAAELAIARQPHIVKGYMVYAEPYQGRGPQKDQAIPATNAGAQITSDVLPLSFSKHPGRGSLNGSATLSSATATEPATDVNPVPLDGARDRSPTTSSATLNGGTRSGAPAPIATGPILASSMEAHPQLATAQIQPRRSRIEGVTPAVVHSFDRAIAPKQPKQSWSSWIGASEIIDSVVPRKDDGAFDWDRASLYWRIFFCIDKLFGTDFCGLYLDD